MQSGTERGARDSKNTHGWVLGVFCERLQTQRSVKAVSYRMRPVLALPCTVRMPPASSFLLVSYLGMVRTPLPPYNPPSRPLTLRRVSPLRVVDERHRQRHRRRRVHRPHVHLRRVAPDEQARAGTARLRVWGGRGGGPGVTSGVTLVRRRAVC